MADIERHLQTVIAARSDGDVEEAAQMLANVRRRLAWRERRGHKVCERCKEAKKPSEFGLHSREPDGLRRECRQCRQSPR